ncbi:MAG: galactarate dehydratase [Acidobacteria bacterium]|nr:galactarate dehydratase [Acidobacteriota bacterium]
MTIEDVKSHLICVHPLDNVAVAVNAGGLPKGTPLTEGFAVREFVPAAHKVALRDIPQGSSIVRYGQVIGYAAIDIAQGAWVHTEIMTLPAPPALDALPLATAVPPELPPITGMTFQGYRNADGSVGTKNLLGITTTVQCVAPTVEFAVRRIKAELLPRYPNVDDVLAITHPYGCGVAINAPGADVPIRTIRNLSLNPNFGGAPMAVSLGCEKLQPARLFPGSPSLPVLGDDGYVIRLQDAEHHSFGDMIAAIMRAAERRLEQLNRRQRTTCPASDLVVGLQCGGSDAFSGVTANPSLGYAADLLVRAGATVMFSEVTEVRDAIHLLTARAASVEVAEELIREMAWYDEYLDRGSADRSANPTPGNKRGGLSNIVEKALGSIAKSGSTAIRAVVRPGDRVINRGLVFAATPASDFICGTLQTAAGMNMHVFTTGEGTPYGLATVPVIKVSSQTQLAERWPDLIDLDAGRIATGEASIEDVGRELFQMILDVASGRRRTWADHWGLHNATALFNPGPVT